MSDGIPKRANIFRKSWFMARFTFIFTPAYLKIVCRGISIWGMRTVGEIDSFYAKDVRAANTAAFVPGRIRRLIESWRSDA